MGVTRVNRLLRFLRCRGTPFACWLVTGVLALSLSGCKKPETQGKIDKSAPAAAVTGTPSAPVAPKSYAYADWSDWQLDCAKRGADTTAPCAAVRKRVCQVEGTKEGVACEFCGGQCREEVADDKSSPLHFYAAWSGWQSNCNTCDPDPKACKAERTRICLDRVAGRQADCEFCGGACKEQEERVSGCAADCKWTQVQSFSDQGCTIANKDDIFAGQWGPRTGSPFNSGCSETQANEQCVKFGRNYYKWGRCVPGCAAPMKN